MNAIEIKNISKSYGEIKALDNVSFEVQKGELFGLIGPDGAGKTTLFRLLTTLINPDAGSATVDGLDIMKDYREIRTRVGYMPGRFSLYPDLSVEENLQFFAAIFGVTVEQSYHLIEPIYKQIEPFKTRRAGKLSGGMKQKLALSCALIHCPSVLFLDEPTTGVDAVSRSEFWDMLSNLKKQGITILVSTPYMDEASRCDRIALMNEGRILGASNSVNSGTSTGSVTELTGSVTEAKGELIKEKGEIKKKILGIDTPENMVKAFDSPLYGVKAKNMFALLKVARKHPGVLDCYPFGEKHHLVVDASFNADDMKKTLVNVEGFCIEPVVPTIEDMFIKLMKQ